MSNMVTTNGSKGSLALSARYQCACKEAKKIGGKVWARYNMKLTYSVTIEQHT